MPVDKILLTIFEVFSFFAGTVLGFFVFELPSFWSPLRQALRTAVFQAALTLLAFYATSSGGNVFVSSFLLSALVRSFHIQYRDYKKGTLRSWFQTLDLPPSQGVLIGYFVVVGLVFVYSLLNFVL